MRHLAVLAVALPLVALSFGAEAQTTGKDGGAPAAAAADAGAAQPTTAAGDASAPAPTTAPTTSADKPAMDGATYTVRLRDLESKVDELKDQIRKSHTRLALLSDTIVSGGAAGARTEVVFKNEMGSAYQLIKALVVLDGAIQYNRADETGALADLKEIPVFTGSVTPGDHTVQIKLTFRGNGYGVFTYLKGYKFDVTSSHSFTVVEGKTLNVTATALERGGVTTPLDQRPAMEWRERVQAIAGSNGQSAEKKPK